MLRSMVINLIFLLFVSSSFALPFPFCAFFVLVSCAVLILDTTCSKALLAFVNLKLYFSSIVQIRRRIISKDDILPCDVEASFLCFGIGCRCYAAELDFFVRDYE